MTSTLRGREGAGGRGYGVNEMLSDVEGWKVSECSGQMSKLYFFKKKIGFAPCPGIMMGRTIYY